MKRGQKTIKVTLYFFTDGLRENNNKFAWDCGIAHLNANKAHGIKTSKNGKTLRKEMCVFNSIEELPAAVRNALKESGISLFSANENRKTDKKVLMED